MTHPVDNIVRCVPFELRAAGDGKPAQMAGHFAVFDQWTEISSWYEGDFVERIAPGAFADVFRSSAPVKVLYDHGYDPSIGNKPLGQVKSLTEDKTGAAYVVDLFDTGYVRDLLPALAAGELGASFRFRVAAESWVDNPKPSDYNPKGLPERSITKVEPLYEFGPVTFPAYAGATAGLRSGTDHFFDRLLRDPHAVRALTERLGPHIVGRMIDDGKAGDAPGRRDADADDVPVATSGLHPSVLRIRAAALALAH